MTARTRAQLTGAAALSVLAGLVLVFFWKIALTNRILVGLDVFSYFYPYRSFVSEALLSGRLPLWNPYLFMGAPLLANSQAAVLYPLHWPLLLLSPPKQVAWSIVIHIWLAGAGAYLFARSAMHLRTLNSLVAAALFAFGGFLGAQVEHINQLNASAWFPWLLLCLEAAISRAPGRWYALLAGSAVISMTLLAGHIQAAYIVLVGAAVYAGVRGLTQLKQTVGRRRLQALTGPGLLVAMLVTGVALSAGQLLPTLELSMLSVRSGGLPYEEAASFSLKPALVFKAFLPPLTWDAPMSEYVAYVGLLGLGLAALAVWRTLRVRRREDAVSESRPWPRDQAWAALALAAVGVFLALGAYNPVYYLLFKFVPGFDLFRAPARWLLLYSFGIALLAGLGVELLPRAKAWRMMVLPLMLIELLFARTRLAYDKPTAPAALESMRTAPAHILADSGADPARFLSMSDLTYDPGDLGDLEAMYSAYLPEDALYDLVVATKMKEILAFNLPLLYRTYSVDGYDGGLLPTARYVALERLFLSRDKIWPDGRLRQQLRTIPPNRLLSLLNVRYVITDKSQDVWLDDVYYDLEHSVMLGRVVLDSLPAFDATELGVVSYLEGTQDLPDATPVARITITGTDGVVITSTLRAGLETAEGAYSPDVSHSQPRIAHLWRDDSGGSDYVSVLSLDQVIRPESIEMHSLLPQSDSAAVVLRGLTLIDARTGSSRSVSIDPAYRLAHSGDVKIYENLAVLPRAFVADKARVVADDEAALSLLLDPSLDPAHEVILAQGRELAGTEVNSAVRSIEYRPDSSEYMVSLSKAGYLVVTDAYYPGWEAEVDGQQVPVVRADIYFRAVPLEPGEHRVALHFRPSTVGWGLGTGLACWLAWGLVACVLAGRAGLNRRHRV